MVHSVDLRMKASTVARLSFDPGDGRSQAESRELGLAVPDPRNDHGVDDVGSHSRTCNCVRPLPHRIAQIRAMVHPVVVDVK